MMPLSRQKQGLGGNSSIAYKRWEPLNENDNDDNGDSLENEPDDTGQVCIMLLKKVLINQKNPNSNGTSFISINKQVQFHQFEEDHSGNGENWGTNNNYASVSTIPDLNFHGSPSFNQQSHTFSFSHRLRLFFNRNHAKSSHKSLPRKKLKPNENSSGYSWRKRPAWYGGKQKEESKTLSEKEIGGYTLTTSPSHSSKTQADLERQSF